MNPLLLVDSYKIHHNRQYPEGMTKLYSNFTPRKSRMKDVDEVVVFGIQHFILEYLIKQFNEEFFGYKYEASHYAEYTLREQTSMKIIDYKKEIIDNYKKHCNVDTKHIEALWDLGYLPIEIKALDEGTLCPIGVPMMTITNTHPEFAWLVNYLETLISCMLWQPITSATIAYEYKKILDKYALETTGSIEGTQWQGHDFSMRGMSSCESAILSGMGHLLSFTGTDTIPAIYQLESSYKATGLIGASVPATEHSVMCMGTKESEIVTFKRLLDLYPTGILSVVSDTWDLWKVCTEYLPQLKEDILKRDGKLVIRPDSGDPIDIICGLPIKKFDTLEDAIGDFEDILGSNQVHGEQEFTCDEEITVQIEDKYYILKADNVDWNRYDKQYYFVEDYNISSEEVAAKPCNKGVIELLWDTFGGTTNEQGYKVLDSHIGAIYGDSITLERAKQICERLKAKGFASTNIVLGIGSYTYQYNTRDTFGFAMKATYGEITHRTCEEPCLLEMNTEGMQVCDAGHCKYPKKEAREIFKDPITDDGTKKSKKGLLRVILNTDDSISCIDQQSWENEQGGLLTTVFKDGKLVKVTTLDEIRNKLN